MKHTSLVEWAKSIGSNAKTHAGQRRAIIASFRPHEKLVHIGSMPLDRDRPYGRYGRSTTRYEWYRAQKLRRQREFAANHPTTLSSPPPATREEVMGYRNYTPQPLADLTHESYGRYAQVGDWYIRCTQDEEKDWNYYAKSYRFPKITISNRKVLIRRVKPDGTMESRDVAVEAWRGNYLLDALITAGVCEKNKVASRLRSVQLHPAFAVTTLREGSLSIYERTLAGEHYDCCVVWHGITYHAGSVKAAVRGLRNKLHSVIQAKNSPIDWALCKKLGFCDAGIRQFCADFNLSTSGRYTAQQIEAVVQTNLSQAAKYKTELCTLAKTVGYGTNLCK